MTQESLSVPYRWPGRNRVCNFITSVDEGAAIVRDAAVPGVRLLVLVAIGAVLILFVIGLIRR